MAFVTEIALLSKGYSFAALVIFIIVRLTYNRYKNGLSHIPGPFLASLTDFWLLVHYVRRKGLEEYEMHQRYNSPVLRVGPNMISVADANAVKIIYGWKPILEKGRLYISQDVTTEDGTVLQNVSSTRDENLHRDLRRPVANAYSLGTLREYEPLVDSTSVCFLRQLQTFADTGTVCPMSKWLQMYAFDVIGEITFSKRFGFLEAAADLHDMMYYTGQAMDWIGMVGQVPTLDEYFRLKGFGHIFRRLRRTGPIMRFTMQQIRAHQRKDSLSRPDFLTRFMEAQERYPEIMTDRRVATFTNTNVSAGSDTTAIALREIVYRLLTHPGALENFTRELEAVLDARMDDENKDVPVTWLEGQSMKYFQALIKECLRLHPPLGQLIPRKVPPGGLDICGHFIPGGTEVGCNAWTVHRDIKTYGESAHEFRPERWLEADAEHLRRMEASNFAFGGGPRVCLGKNIAMLEISKVIPELFRRYEICLVDAKRYTRRPGWLVLQQGLDVTLRRKI